MKQKDLSVKIKWVKDGEYNFYIKVNGTYLKNRDGKRVRIHNDDKQWITNHIQWREPTMFTIDY